MNSSSRKNLIKTYDLLDLSIGYESNPKMYESLDIRGVADGKGDWVKTADFMVLEARFAVLTAQRDKLVEALREAYQITHYSRGSMQDIDDVIERALRLCGTAP